MRTSWRVWLPAIVLVQVLVIGLDVSLLWPEPSQAEEALDRLHDGMTFQAAANAIGGPCASSLTYGSYDGEGPYGWHCAFGFPDGSVLAARLRPAGDLPRHYPRSEDKVSDLNDKGPLDQPSASVRPAGIRPAWHEAAALARPWGPPHSARSIRSVDKVSDLNDKLFLDQPSASVRPAGTRPVWKEEAAAFARPWARLHSFRRVLSRLIPGL
jgi:hypothetical protein